MKQKTIVILILLLNISLCFAHPGSLDANGGHYNRKTGEYHYHDGINKSSGSNSSGYDYNYKTEKQRELERLKEEQERIREERRIEEANRQYKINIQKNNCKTLWYIFIFLALFAVIKNISLLKSLNSKTTELSEWEYIKPEKSIKIINLPHGINLNEEGLPECVFMTNKGMASYNVYTTNRGRKYHQSFCETIQGKKCTKYNIINVPNYFQECKLCSVKYPYEHTWFTDAEKIYIL